ncbi:MAG TPA: urease accessory UreF family protein [Candidatus Angelobacter sp.]|nr:urease accessory UreF family protein [Candidatus Angelobacter sp.]
MNDLSETKPSSSGVGLADDQSAFLKLLQLADSSFPIGALAHSFGVETLVSSGSITVTEVPGFLQAYLEETGTMQACFCRAGFHAASEFSSERWVQINEHLSALKPARESRSGEAVLGLRLMVSVMALGDFPLLRASLDAAKRVGVHVHHGPAFGLVSAVLAFDEEQVVLAYLHQMLANLVSAFQRLLPIGQSLATRLLWEMKPTIIGAAHDSRISDEYAGCFMPLLDWGAMEHADLPTRLFIS